MGRYTVLLRAMDCGAGFLTGEKNHSGVPERGRELRVSDLGAAISYAIIYGRASVKSVIQCNEKLFIDKENFERDGLDFGLM